MLAYYMKQAPAAPATLEQSLSYPIRSKQLQSVFNYVISEIRGDPMTIDTRWDVERKISLVERTRLALGGAGTPIENLREMLQQMKFNLEIPDMTQINNALAILRNQRVQIRTGSTTGYSLPQKFKMGTEETQIPFQGKNYTLRILPVNAKPNLNTADVEALERYLMFLGMQEKISEKLAQLIVDYRDEDGEARGANTEGPYNTDPRFTVKSSNQEIRRFDELTALPGIDSAMIRFLRQHFTLYGEDPRINLLYNSPEAIMAYTDLQAEIVTSALDYEKNKNDPLRNETLEVLIGSKPAEIWKNSVTDTTLEDQPINIILTGDGLMIDAVYYPKERKIADIYID